MKNIIMTISFMLCVTCLVGCGSGEQAMTSIIQNETEVETLWRIETPYCELCLPKEFEEHVITEIKMEDSYSILFKTKEKGVDLFVLYFDNETENLIGTLPLATENKVLYADFADLDNEDENYLEYSTYQEGINTIIDNLVAEYNFIIDDVIEYDDKTTFDIENEFVTLKYPNKWKEEVEIYKEEKCIKFFYDKVALFDVYFEECDGDHIGTYKNIPIYIISYIFDKDSITEEQHRKLSAMQHDVNVIIDNLVQDDNFVINN